MGFMQNIYTDDAIVFITSDAPTAGTISIPGTGWSQNFTVTPGVTTQVHPPMADALDVTNDVVTNQGVHVVTDECVSVYTYNFGNATADGNVVAPINSIGQDYIVNTYRETSGSNNYNGATELLVVGNYDATTVTITPSVVAGTHAAGAPFTVTVDSGDTYLLQSDNDLSGTTVTGTNGKDFSLFAGSVCITVNLACCCDHICEQMAPLANLGTEYITVPFGVPQPDKFRVVATQNATTVKLNNTTITTLNAGQYYDFTTNQRAFVSSDKTISLVQLMGSSQSGGSNNQNGDPMMIAQSPVSERINIITFPTFPLSPGQTHYWFANIVAKTTDIANVTLDGAGLPGGTFTPVAANTLYSTANVPLTFGDHTLKSNEGVIAYIYGYTDQWESFGYSAGVRVAIPFLSIYDSTKAYCPDDTVNISLDVPDTAKLIYTEWDLGDGSPHVYDTLHFFHTYHNYGKYPVTFIYELLGACLKDTITIDTIKVLGPEPTLYGPYNLCSAQNLDIKAGFRIPPDSIFWTIGNTTIVTTDTAYILHLYADQDTVVYIHNIVNGICDGYDTAYIYVAHDTAGFTFSNACEGVAVNFQNTSQVVPNSTYQWLWDYGDGTTSAAFSGSHQYTTGGTFTVKLNLISPSGCTDSISHQVTIYGQPHADFDGTGLCRNSVLTPTNNSTISSGTITYTWDFGDNTPLNTQANPSHTYSQSGAYNVKLTASSPGCFDSITKPINVIIGANPMFWGSATCLGQPTNFTDATINTSGSAILDYRWDFGDGNSTTGQNVTNTYAAAGTYNVTLVLVYGSGCEDTLVKPQSVNDAPAVAFTVPNLCNSGTATPVNTTTIANGSVSYSWNFGDNTAIDNSQNPTHTYALSGNYDIQLTAVSDSGCTDSITNTIQVIRGTIIDFDVPAVCEGTTSVFTDQTTNPYNTTIYAYRWDFGDAATDSVQNPTHTYATFGSYNATVVLYYDSTCTDSLTKVVTVNENPVAAFTVADVCNDSVAAPNNTSTISSGTLSYQWNFGDGSSALTAQNPTHAYALTNTYNIQLITTSGAGCADTTTNPVIVTIGTLINFTSPAVCDGATMNFTDQTINPYNTTINSYNWSFGDGNTASQQNTTHTYSTFGTYNVQLMLDYGNNCADSLTKAVTVNENPVAAFTVADVCNDSVAAPNNTSTISSGTLSYQWNFGDGPSAITAQNPTHAYALTNTYNILLITTSGAGCADTATNPVIVIIGTHIDFIAPDVCDGATMNFTDQTTNPYNTNINSYNWSFGDGNTASQQNTTHTYSTFGTYNVQLMLDYGNNCMDSVTKPVNVNQNPVADFNATTPCDRNAVQFTDASTPAADIITYDWKFGDGRTSILQNPQHLYAGFGTYNTGLTVTTSHTCADSITKPVTVLQVGQANFNAPGVCYPNATQFNNTTDTVTFPVSTFTWTFGSGNAGSNQTSPTYNYPAAGIYNVTIIANFANGCTDTTTGTTEVYVVPSVSNVLQNVSCNNGSDGSIALTPVSGTTPFNYAWSNSPANAPTNAPIAAGSYDVTFTDAHTCTATETYVLTEPNELLFDTATSEISCYNYTDGTTTVMPYGGTPTYTYLWSNGSTSATAYGLGAGIYSVTITDGNACTVATTLQLDNPLKFTISLPLADTLELGHSVYLTPTYTNGNAIDWLWIPANALSCVTCQNTEVTTYYNTLYSVVATTDKGCVDTAAIFIWVNGEREVFIPNVFTPDGNGTNDYFEVFGNKEAWKFFSVQIFDRIGEKVYDSNDMNFKWDGTYKGKKLNPGVLVYTVNVTYLDNYTEKLFKGSVTLIR